MMMDGSSAALAVAGWGATAFGIWRLNEVWRDKNQRRTLLLLGAVLVAAGIGAHQTMAWWAHETGSWDFPIAKHAYRAMWAAGLLLLAGAASWPRCGHKGWLALAALGAAAWLGAWAV